MLLELHNIPAAHTIEETKIRIVELKVRIARAEDILGMQIQDMQKMTALLQVIDPTTKQHTATMKSSGFDDFYTRVMNFTNIASIGCGNTPKPIVNSVGLHHNNIETENYYVGEEHDDQEVFGINGLGGKGEGCHNCGGLDHWARECPKGGSKGKGFKGGGKGKGVAIVRVHQRLLFK